MADIELRIQENNSTYTIDRFNGLQSVQSTTQSTADPRGINYATLPNTGSAEIVDIGGEIRNKIEQGSIENSNLPVELYINNYHVQMHITTDSNYSSDANFTIQMSNDLQKLENLIYNGRNLTLNTTLYTLLKEILIQLGVGSFGVDVILNRDIVDKNGNTSITMYDFLNSITIPYAYLKNSTYREVLDKFCEITQTNLIKEDNGGYKFISARPIIFAEDTPIVIPYTYQYSPFEYDVIVKNKVYSPFIPSNSAGFKWETIDNRAVTVYKFTDYTTDFSQYINVLGSANYNKALTILALHKPYISSTQTVTTYGSIFKFSINKPSPNIKYSPYIYQIFDRYAYWVYNSGESTTSGTYSVDVYDNTYSDSTIISDWVNYNGSNIDSLKNSAPFLGFKIREEENVCTVFVILRTDTLDQSNQVTYVSGTHNIDLRYREYTEYFEEPISTPDISLPQNELIQNGATYNNEDLATYIANNIATEYKDGIRVGTITLACTNFYDENDNLVVNFNNGEIIKVGDVLKVDGSNLLWRVINRTFRYSDGAPYVDLTLREIIAKYKLYLNDMSYGYYINHPIDVVYGKHINDLPNITDVHGLWSLKDILDVTGYRFNNWKIDDMVITNDTIWDYTIDKTATMDLTDISTIITLNNTSGADAQITLKVNGFENGEITTGMIYVNETIYDYDSTPTPYMTEEAFVNGENTFTITLQQGVNTIRIAYMEHNFNEGFISSPQYVTSIVIGEKYSSTINARTFSGFTGLISATIPSNITSINSEVFSGCSNLSVVNIYTTSSSFKVSNLFVTWFKNCPSTLILHIPSVVTDPATAYGTEWNSTFTKHLTYYADL